jgi:hypothetical protein
VSGDAKLVQRLDRRDVLTDEPREFRRMGRDDEMTRAGNGSPATIWRVAMAGSFTALPAIRSPLRHCVQKPGGSTLKPTPLTSQLLSTVEEQVKSFIQRCWYCHTPHVNKIVVPAI